MADAFSYDVFLSHSPQDREVVREIAARLQFDGLRVWLDDWEIRPDDSITETIGEGLDRARVLVLCLSKNTFGAALARLEAGTFRFRDPLNKERRFIPLRLDSSLIEGSLAQYSSVNWFSARREKEYAKLLEACRATGKLVSAEAPPVLELGSGRVVRLAYEGLVPACAFSPDGKCALTGGMDNEVWLWDTGTGRSLRVLNDHTDSAWSLAWSLDQRRILTGGLDRTMRLWDVQSGKCLRLFKGQSAEILSVALSSDQRMALSGSTDHTVRLWDLETGHCRVFEGHLGNVWSVAWSADQLRALSGALDRTVRLWDVNAGRCLRVLEGHTGNIWSLAWSADQLRALSGSMDRTVRLWDLETGRCLRVLKGHTGQVRSVVWSGGQRCALSGADDKTVRLWDVETGHCLRVLEGHVSEVRAVGWIADQRLAMSCDSSGFIRVWDLSDHIADGPVPETFQPSVLPFSYQIQYTNAKVLLVGESGVGKTGLSKRLVLNEWQPSDSTVGAWATQWKLPVSSGEGLDSEIWLWDFGGQADQRLIHQLYMDETALAVLVFDGQKEDLFETLDQWDRDLTRASHQTFSKLLVAGRMDAGGLRVGRAQIEAFMRERGYLCLLETSAKTNLGCEELKQAILDSIRWENIPWRSSPLLFIRLKEEIVRLKDAGRVLMRFNELRETLQLRLLEEEGGEVLRFTDAELKAVVSLLAGPGVVWELKFGNWVLLQPERINAYAQAVIQTMREDEHERGCLPEEQVLKGDLKYHSSMPRLEGDEERFVLLAMHQILVERGLCLREHTEKGPVLIFPSYYRRERPELVGHPAVLVSYRFNGFLDDVYATLVVRLHHTHPFQKDQLWRYAADFKTLTGKQLGVKMTRRTAGAAELKVYFDPAIEIGEKIIFSQYVHEHLLQNAKDVERLRHYLCPHCFTPVANREVAMRKLAEGKKDIVCADCEKRVPLWDELEDLFASPEMKRRVHELQEQVSIVLDNESKERALVGEVISTVALAGQISREFHVSDHGIDMEIEFKSDAGKATGRKVYLQLKSGDSYRRKRRSDGAEIFTIKQERHARYWMDQMFSVLLVVRSSTGEIRWMEVRDWLRRETGDGKKPVKQIVFEGERFDVMSVRRWRDKALRSGSS